MKESFIVLFLLFLSNINEHFPESNDYNKNTFINYNIYITINQSILYLNELYNDYGINYKDTIIIYNMLNIYHITNNTQINLQDSFIFINDKSIFEEIINKIINFYNPNDSIILLVKENILKDLTSEEVKKYKQIQNCFIITYNKDLIYNELISIKNNKTKIKEIELYINLTYSNYPTTGYAIFLCIFFITTNIILIFFIIKYLNINNQNKLGIHIIIIICYLIVNLCYVFTFVEILLSKKCLLYKLIPKEYFIVKIIKVILFCIGKNSIMLLFLLLSRAYCILFFDNQYKNKYIKQMLIITLVDYLLQFFFKFFDFYLFKFIYIKDLYNIIYYILLGIYIYHKGINIYFGLLEILYVVENDNMRIRTQKEINDIRRVIIKKIDIRKQSLLIYFLFCLIGIISPFIYLLFIYSFKGNTIYDIFTLFQFSIAICLISMVFYPEQLLLYYTLNYEQLINGIPEDFLNEYLYRFSKENYITRKDSQFMIQYKSPILIFNPYQILKEDININNLNEKHINKNDEIKIINSYFEKGQIGFLSNID